MEIGVFVALATSLFFILDPFASLPMFMAITKGLDHGTIDRYANMSVLVAAILLIVFVLIGPQLMGVFGVTMESFRVAGGIVLLLMSVEIIFSLKLSNVKDESAGPWIVIATPVLTGPGVITASIVMSAEYGSLMVLVAGIVALAVTWMLLRSSELIIRMVGMQTINVMSKIVGLLIAAMAVEYIFRGASMWFSAYGQVASMTFL